VECRNLLTPGGLVPPSSTHANGGQFKFVAKGGDKKQQSQQQQIKPKKKEKLFDEEIEGLQKF
jgi:hypothetical protein